MFEEVASLLSPCEVLPTVLAAIGSCLLLAEAAQYRDTHRGLNDLTSEEVFAATPEAIQASPPSFVDETAYEEAEEDALDGCAKVAGAVCTLRCP